MTAVVRKEYIVTTLGGVSRLDLAVLRPNYSHEHWYLNASLFLLFQELNSLDLSFNGIYGWVSNEGTFISQSKSR